MSDLYPEQKIEQNQERINYYKRTELLSIPKDYFDLMKEQLGTEFNQMYVEKKTCTRICAATLSHLEALKEEMMLFKQQLDVVRHSVNLEETTEEQPQQFVVIPEEEAAEKISAFVNSHPGVRTSDIICELGLDPNLTLKVLRKLQEESKIIGKTIESK
jgi:hypothetical protein